jgi:hypothetical protein
MPLDRHGAGPPVASVAALAAIPDPTTGRLHAPMPMKGLIEMSKEVSLLEEIESRLAHYREQVPELIALRAALLPFDDVIHTWMAVPKGHSCCPDGDSHFLVGTYAPDDPEVSVWFKVYADQVITYSTSAAGCATEGWHDPPEEISFVGMLDYLRQLPRPFQSFIARKVR